MSFTRKRGLSLFDTLNYVFVVLVSVACLLPFVYVVSLSLTSEHVYVPFDFRFFPKKLSLEAYTYMLSTRSFGDALYSTVFVTAVGTVLNILFTFTAAYGLTKRELPHRGRHQRADRVLPWSSTPGSCRTTCSCAASASSTATGP